MECNEQGKRWRGYYITAYGIAVKHGFKGTEAEWLETLKGDKVQLRYNEDTKTLEWKYEDADEWLELMDINALQGEVVTEVLEQATAAKEAAETAQAGAEAAQEAAESARTGAETAAASAAEQAAAAGKSAAAAAQDAQNAAAAKTGAESARDAAEAAKSEAQESAASAQESAATARQEAGKAVDSAAAAAGSAEDAAKSAEAAEAAQKAVSDSATAAEAARKAAEAAAAQAAGDADAAEESASAAAGSASTASQKAEDAGASAAAAAGSASQASESAAQAGESAEGAAASRDAAVMAQGKAETARTAAESAKTAAEAARDSAVTASETAVSAKETAVSAKNGAEAAAGNASDSAGEAAASAELAGQKAAAAEKSAEAAAASAASIGQAEENAAASATEAESWAVGGTGTREGEDTNNAKYWSARAQDAAGGGVTSFNNRTGAVRPVKGDYTADLVTFTDGQTFQEKYDSGELTGPAGADGAPGQQGQPGADGDPGPAGQDGADGKDATINGVNALTLAASGGLNGSQSGSTYTIDGSGKQDKLTGTAGQVVGFDAEGNAIPQAVPSGLPEGGTVGQLLEKTEGGAEWADKPVMYVNITPPAGDSPFGTADHTIAEITQAVLNGVTVLSKISEGTDTKVIPLSTVTDSVASFSSTSVDYGGSVIANIVPQEQSEVVIIAEDQFRASQILYDKGTSGLDSDDVQGAIKELAKNKQDSADAVTVSGGGTMQMGESLGEGPYTIEVTEDGEGGDLSAEYVGYSNTGSGLEATNVQEAIDELAQKGGGEYLPLTGGTMQGDITIPADKAIKHGGSAAQIKMMPNGNIRIEAPLAEGAAAITVGTSGINLVNNTTQVLQTSESGVALKANTDMTGHKIANLAAPSDSADAANKQYVDTSVEQALGSIGYSLIKEYTSPGSYTHTFDRKYTDVFVVVVGAGGGGGSSGERGGGGGGGGAVACFHVLDSSTIQNNNIVVGTGGAGAVSSLGPSVTNNGSAGGSSSAFGITVPGGSGGIANLGGMGGGYAPNEIVPGWLMIGGSGGSHNNNGDGDGNAGPIISIVGFKPFGGGGGGGGNPSLNDPPTPGGNGGDGGAGNGGAGATGQSNAIMGKNGTRGGGGGGGGAGWTFRSSEYKPSGIGGKGGDGYVAIYARGIS